jgi:hypothetical protein
MALENIVGIVDNKNLIERNSEIILLIIEKSLERWSMKMRKNLHEHENIHAI